MYENGKVSEIIEEDMPVSRGPDDKWCISTIGTNDNNLNSFEGV